MQIAAAAAAAKAAKEAEKNAAREKKEAAKSGKGKGKAGGKGDRAPAVALPSPHRFDEAPLDPMGWWEDRNLMGLYELCEMGFSRHEAEQVLREKGALYYHMWT